MSSFSPTPQDPNHHRAAAQYSFNHFLIYSDLPTPVAKVVDGIYTTTQELQYFVIEFLDWEPGKQVLLPVHLAQVDLSQQRLYVPSLNREQVLQTPAYNRPPAVASPSFPVQSQSTIAQEMPMRSLEQSAPLEAALPLEGYGAAPAPIPPMQPQQAVPPSPTVPPAPVSPTPVPPLLVSPTRPPAEVSQEEVIRLQEERLIVDRTKHKVGEVVVRKEIETEYIQVPVQREKLIVEQVGADPKQLAEIDLTDPTTLPATHPREAQLPPLPPQER